MSGTALGAAALATGSTAMGATTTTLPTDIGGTLTIGLIGPFTGATGHLGEQMENGAEAACDEANQLKGTLDRTFQVHTFDDTDAIASAITNAQFAVDDGTIIAVIGHLRGKITEAALDTYARAMMPLVIPVSTLDRLTSDGYTNVLRLTTKDTVEGQLDAHEVNAVHSPKVVAVVTVDDDYGPDVANGFARQLQDLKVDARVAVLPYDKIDYVAYSKALAAAKPDVVYLAGTVTQLGPMLGAMRDAGYTGPVYASQGFFDPTTIAKYGTAAEGLIASSSMPPLNIAPSVFRLKNDYETKYGTMTPLAAFSYAATQIVISAYQATGALDRNTVLHALTRPNTTYQTIVGDFTFTNSGDPQQPNVYFYQVTNGAWKYLHAAHSSGFLIK